MLYFSLLRNQWRQSLRSFRLRSRWLSFLVLGLLGGYFVFVLVSAGFVFRELLAEAAPGRDPVAFVGEHLLTVFLFLFTLRFFVQKTPQMGLQPYLHLPIRRSRLVRFFTVASLGSVHNVLPLLFLVPFWARHLAGTTGTAGAAGSAAWLAGAVLLVVLSNYGVIAARALLTGGPRQMTGFVLFVASLFVADLALGTDVAARVSGPLFEGLAAGRPAALVPIVLLLLAAVVLTDRLLHRRLLDAAEDQSGPTLGWTLDFAPARGPVFNLVLLETKLMWRHRRPRTYAFLAAALGTIYVAVMLADEPMQGGVLAGIVGVFASGTFALNYGQLMFSWESAYFDGHLARALDLRDAVLAKLLLLQASCVVFYVLSLPIFVWLAPGLLGLHTAFLFYNAGVTSALMLALGISNQKAVDLRRSGSFMNYEGFSLVHWLWFIPTAVPPILLLVLLGDRPRIALLVLAGVGVAGLLLTAPVTAFFARSLRRRKYAMAAGFRGDP